jgi:Na+-translocating ferredoxin:NAD+ oxidoreductase subunit B
MSILTAIFALGGLTLVLAIMLIVANKRLYVFEDPRINTVEDMLPHANCGACGLPGCRPFAEALVAGKVLPGKCTVSSDVGQQAIADYLGISIGQQSQLRRTKQLPRSCIGLRRWKRMLLGMPGFR